MRIAIGSYHADRCPWNPFRHGFYLSGGREDIFRIAADTHYEFGRMLAIVEGAELLEFVDTPKRMVVLETLGRRFIRATPDEIARNPRSRSAMLRGVERLLDDLTEDPVVVAP